MGERKLTDEARAVEAWDAWWDARPDGSLVTPLPMPDVQSLAGAMFNAGLAARDSTVEDAA